MPAIFKQLDEIEDEEEKNRAMIEHLLQKDELDVNTVHDLDLVQKEEMQLGIGTLDSDHFDPLIQMLHSFIPNGNDDDEVELDIDNIDDVLQVKMYNYMLQAIRQQEEERIRREGGVNGNANDNNIGQALMQQTLQSHEEETEVQQQEQEEEEDEASMEVEQSMQSME